MLYTSPWSGFELTSVVIGTDCIGSCKFNYHMIMAMTVKFQSTLLLLPDEINVKIEINNTLYNGNWMSNVIEINNVMETEYQMSLK